MRLLLASVIALAPMSVSTTGRSEPRSAKDCAPIEDSFAYNECIAKFGPSGDGKIVSHGKGAVLANAPPYAPVDGPLPEVNLASHPETGRVAAPRAAAQPARSAPARVSGSIYQRAANGRYFAVFQVGAGAPRAAPAVPRAKAPVARAAPKFRTAASYYPRWRGYRHH